MSKSDIAARIQKLLSKAESAHEIGSIQEAQTFAAKAQELMEKHKLTMSEIEFTKHQREDPIEEVAIKAGAQRTDWIEELARVIAFAHQCRILVSRGGFIWFVGRRSDREMAEYVFLVLYRTCNELATTEGKKVRKAARAAGEAHKGYGFTQNFRKGFIRAINQRYREESEMRKRGMTQAERHVAMVRLTGKDVDTYIDEKYKKAKPARQIGRKAAANEEGLARGYAAGQAAHGRVKRAVSESKADRTKRLGA